VLRTGFLHPRRGFFQPDGGRASLTTTAAYEFTAVLGAPATCDAGRTVQVGTSDSFAATV
jgi:hypothetical protein